MPPCIVDSSTAEGKKARNALQLNNLKKAIPEAAFEKSLVKSTLYMLMDYAIWGSLLYGMWTFCHSGLWEALPFWQQALISVVWWNVTGFFMWSMFIIGHDCGHGTFSDYEVINDIMGHISHGSILVPYWPWQLSHRRHHMYHNHIEKDYSHPWYTEERFQREDEKLANWMDKNSWVRAFFPIVGWQIYLYGMPDGSHFIPYKEQRLWKDTPSNEYVKCIISAIVVVGWLAAAYFLFGQDVNALVFYYLVPWAIFGWWLITVTYLQHHNPHTVVYDDDDWKFVDAAFETVDRTFGFGLDTLHHHITDGHVVHHLFFTKIPHYNLPMATKALKRYMEDNNLGSLYKYEKTYDFVYRVHKYFVQFGFRSKRAAPAAAKSTDGVNGSEPKKVK